MEEKPNLPEKVQQFVEQVGKPVTPRQIDLYTRLQELEERSKHLATIIESWEEQQTQDREMRKKYANWLMYGMGVQVLAINVIFVLIGCRVLTFEPWTANTFIMAVFAEIASLVLLFVKYLFPETSDKILDLIDRFLSGKSQ
jgi:hypothetical protein